LVVAKLAPRLTTATSESSLPDLLLHPGGARSDDEFVEIAIYEEQGLDTKDVNRVTLQRAPTTSEESLRWQLIHEICATRGIELIE
jgi:hypothetical protein